MKKRRITSIILLLIATIIVAGSIWVSRFFGDITFDQILFHLSTDLGDTDVNTIINCCKYIFFPLMIFLILLFLYIMLKKHSIHFKKFIDSYNKNKIIFYFNKFEVVFSVIVIFGAVYYSMSLLKVFEYFKEQSVVSTFIEMEYVDPNSVKITFPKEKKNLLFIYLESIESSMASKEKGGLFDNNYIPYLTDLANDNDNFSNSKGFGGINTIYGTSWSTAGYIASSAGIPVKTSVDIYKININNIKNAHKNVSTLGDILESEYNEELMLGSSASFGGIQEYFENHGNYKIWDRDYALKNNLVNKKELNSWGLYDHDLYEFAKKELLSLSKEKRPFYFTMATIGAHAPNGFVDKNCPTKYSTSYENSIYCTDVNTKNFISWLKKQSFYKNTTIVMVGDHYSMSTTMFEKQDFSKRKIYNVILNSSLKTGNTNNRISTMFDMFPTTLASLGFTIDGDRLALGTNLYSEKETLAEKYGISKMDLELSKKSVYYNQVLKD